MVLLAIVIFGKLMQFQTQKPENYITR